VTLPDNRHHHDGLRSFRAPDIRVPSRDPPGTNRMTPPALRLAVVVSHPIQYYAPWFHWLADQGWTLRVFYLWDFGVAQRQDRGFGRAVVWDVDLLSGYEHEFVPNISRAPGTHHLRGLN